MILLHGGGSFAHPFVSRAAFRNGVRQKSQLSLVSEIELNLDQLTRIIGVGLLLRHRPYVPLAPMSFMTLRRVQVGRSFLDPITAALRLGLIPLIHGDLAFDETRGFGIVSANRIVSFLAEKIGALWGLVGTDLD